MGQEERIKEGAVIRKERYRCIEERKYIGGVECAERKDAGGLSGIGRKDTGVLCGQEGRNIE